MPQARGVVDDVIDHRVHEALELGFGHGFHALGRHADAHAGDHHLGQRRVQHALVAELLLQAGGGAKHAAVDAHVLAEHDHRRVCFHLVRQRQRDGFYKRDLGHQWLPPFAGKRRAISRCSSRWCGKSLNM